MVVSRSRLPAGPSDLMLRMVNVMVDSYLELRKQLSLELDDWQQKLLRPRSEGAHWQSLMVARAQLHMLEDLCEEQHDAMQEWLDTAREQPPPAVSLAERDGLIARARDVLEHIQLSAQSHRTNDIMRTLTALTAIFLPLNLIAGIFGMNFEFLPLIHVEAGFWWALAGMGLTAVALGLLFWRKRYLARSGR